MLSSRSSDALRFLSSLLMSSLAFAVALEEASIASASAIRAFVCWASIFHFSLCPVHLGIGLVDPGTNEKARNFLWSRHQNVEFLRGH